MQLCGPNYYNLGGTQFEIDHFNDDFGKIVETKFIMVEKLFPDKENSEEYYLIGCELKGEIFIAVEKEDGISVE